MAGKVEVFADYLGDEIFANVYSSCTVCCHVYGKGYAMLQFSRLCGCCKMNMCSNCDRRKIRCIEKKEKRECSREKPCDFCTDVSHAYLRCDKRAIPDTRYFRFGTESKQ